MRLKDRRAFSKPEVMIIPMIDIMFFLLVFFMLSTLYMVDLKTIPVNMPKVQNAQSQTNVNYLVTMKADGTLYLENKLIDEDTLLQGAKEKYEENNNFAVVIRADENVDYGKIMALLDKFKAVGNMYQISNNQTLGLTEQEIVKNMKLITDKIIEQERVARKYLGKNQIGLADKVYRAFGILENARILSSNECIDLFRAATVRAERGLDYPYSRSFAASVKMSF